jgi:hypothetical protein
MSKAREPGRARPWRIALPLGLVIVLAIGWSIYWFVAANFAEARIERLIARQAERGTEVTCTERTFGGFPFRFILTCRDAGIVLNRPGQVVEIKLPELRGIVQAYNLTHAIGELTGPMEISLRQTGSPDRAARITWSTALVSVQTSSLEISGGDLSADDISIWTGLYVGDLDGDPSSTIAHYEAHIRRSTEGNGAGDLPDFDFVTTATDLVVPLPAPARRNASVSEASLSGTAFDLPLHERSNWRQFLRSWQQAGGKLDIGRLWLDGADTAISAAGEMMLSPSGRPDGNLAIDIVGIDQLLQRVNQSASSSVAGMVQFAALMVRGVATQSSVEGKPALRIDVQFDDGEAKIQGRTISRIGPFYPTEGS